MRNVRVFCGCTCVQYAYNTGYVVWMVWRNLVLVPLGGCPLCAALFCLTPLYLPLRYREGKAPLSSGELRTCACVCSLPDPNPP